MTKWKESGRTVLRRSFTQTPRSWSEEGVWNNEEPCLVDEVERSGPTALTRVDHPDPRSRSERGLERHKEPCSVGEMPYERRNGN